MTGWKTILVVVLQFVAYIFAWDQLVNYVDPQTIAIVAAVLMGILRFLTSTPVFNR